MIDTHCHIDMYKNPLEIAKECEKLGITTIGMTNLPSHFELGYNHLLHLKRVRLALGMHPLYADLHEKEFSKFTENLFKTSFIGEIGLDFSKEGISTKDLQIKSFTRILKTLEGKKKILSLHSRNAEKEVFNYLTEHKIKSAIFHWYSGSLGLIKDISNAGYFFSVNPAMVKSKSGNDVIDKIPLANILTETDGPFVKHNGREVRPKDISIVISFLSEKWSIGECEVKNIIKNNFEKLILMIK